MRTRLAIEIAHEYGLFIKTRPDKPVGIPKLKFSTKELKYFWPTSNKKLGNCAFDEFSKKQNNTSLPGKPELFKDLKLHAQAKAIRKEITEQYRSILKDVIKSDKEEPVSDVFEKRDYAVFEAMKKLCREYGLLS